MHNTEESSRYNSACKEMWWILRDFHTGAVIQTYWQNDEPEPKRVTALLVLKSPRSKRGWKNNIWLAKIEGWRSVIPYDRAAKGRLLPQQIQGHSESCPKRAQGTHLQCATSLWAVPLPAGPMEGFLGAGVGQGQWILCHVPLWSQILYEWQN